jgi:hypothetical protein
MNMENNIILYQTGELQLEATARKIRVVQPEGNKNVSRELDFYNLDAIIAVGYRVNSKQATQFRIWATNTLKGFPYCRQKKTWRSSWNCKAGKKRKSTGGQPNF